MPDYSGGADLSSRIFELDIAIVVGYFYIHFWGCTLYGITV